jgi:hypothetical protein
LRGRIVDLQGIDALDGLREAAALHGRVLAEAG